MVPAGNSNRSCYISDITQHPVLIYLHCFTSISPRRKPSTLREGSMWLNFSIEVKKIFLQTTWTLPKSSNESVALRTHLINLLFVPCQIKDVSRLDEDLLSANNTISSSDWIIQEYRNFIPLKRVMVFGYIKILLCQ